MKTRVYRIEMWGDQIDTLRQIDPLTGEIRAGQEDIAARAHLSEDALRDAESSATRAIVGIRKSVVVEERAGEQKQVRGGAARGAAHDV